MIAIFGTAPGADPVREPATDPGARADRRRGRGGPRRELAGPGDEQRLREWCAVQPRDRLRRGRGLRRGGRGARRLGRPPRGARRGRRASGARRTTRCGPGPPPSAGRGGKVAVAVGSPPRDRGGRCQRRRRPATRGPIARRPTRWRRAAPRVIAILGGPRTPRAASRPSPERFGHWPGRRGPICPSLFAAGRSARAAFSGVLRAAPGPEPRAGGRTTCSPSGSSPATPPPSAASSTGSTDRSPRAAQRRCSDTAAAYLESGGALEATARALFIHPNTVRYRLGRSTTSPATT